MEERLQEVTSRMIDKLEIAIDELDSYVISTKTKEKKLEYDDEGKKPLYEHTEEKEQIEVIKGPIDRSALKTLVSALKELKGEDSQSGGDITVLLSEDAGELSV